MLTDGSRLSRAATEYKCPLPVPGLCGVVTISLQVIGEVILIYAGVTTFTADIDDEEIPTRTPWCSGFKSISPLSTPTPRRPGYSTVNSVPINGNGEVLMSVNDSQVSTEEDRRSPRHDVLPGDGPQSPPPSRGLGGNPPLLRALGC